MKFLKFIALLGLIVLGTQPLNASLFNLSTLLQKGSDISKFGPINFFVACSAGAFAYSTLPKIWREKLTNNIPTQTLRNIAESEIAQSARILVKCTTGSILAAYILYNNWSFSVPNFLARTQ